VIDCKRQLEKLTSVPASSIRLIKQGKILADDAVIHEGKLMMVRGTANPSTPASSPPASPSTVTVTLRDPVRGVLLRDVKLHRETPIAEAVALAARALHLPTSIREWALFWSAGKLLLRSDLALADYVGLTDGAELFVVPLLPPGETPPPAVLRCGEAELSEAVLGCVLAPPPEKEAAAPKQACCGVPEQMRAGLLSSPRQIDLRQLDLKLLVGAPLAPLAPLEGEEAREALEERCAQLCGSLEAEAKRAARKAKSPRRASQSEFSGLAKGFLAAPRGKRRAAAAKARAVAAAEPSDGRPRCKACACRLGAAASLGGQCKCGGSYCAAHMHSHACSFDHRAWHKRKLAAENVKVVSSKLPQGSL